MNRVRAVVAHAARTGLEIEEICLPAPGPGQVRVRVCAAAVCRSDLSMVDGTLTPRYPLVLGHEAAGTVTEVGANARLAVGDHVALTWIPPCRRCWFCTHDQPWLCETTCSPAVRRGTTADGTPVHVSLGLGALAQEVVVADVAAVRVPRSLPMPVAALLGCAAITGLGAVRRTARVGSGEAVAVIGLGGIGLSVVIGARAAGATPVIAADISPAKRELALAAGATHFVPADDDLPATIRGLTGGRGADHAFECAGRAAAIMTAWRTTRRGGQVVVVGMGGRDDQVRLGALEMFEAARTLRTSVCGSSDPDQDIPELAQAVLDGTLPLDRLITNRIGLDEAPAAFGRMARADGARSVVVFPPA